MTSLHRYFLLFAVSLSVLCCGPQGHDTPQESDLKSWTGTVSGYSGGTSPDAPAMLWHDGDSVAMYTGNSSDRFENCVFSTFPGTPASSSVFRIEKGQPAPGKDGEWYQAVYPWSSVYMWGAPGSRSCHVNIPASQSLQAGEYGMRGAPLAACSKGGGSFVFCHLTAYISFTIAGASPSFNSVTVEGDGSEALARRVKVTFGDAIEVVEETSSAGRSTSVGVSTSDGRAFPAGTYYIPIIAKTYSSGLTVTLTGPLGERTVNSYSGPVTLAAGQVADLGTLGDAGHEIFSLPCSQNYALNEDLVSRIGDRCARVEIVVSGADGVGSVKLSSSGLLAGRVDSSPFSGGCYVSEGVDHIVFNTTAPGTSSTQGSTLSVPVLICPGSYPDGLELTLCSTDHRVMHTSLPAFSVSAGEKKSFGVAFVPDPDILWYEGFDSLVWGSDYLADGASGPGMVPGKWSGGTSADVALTGYEEASADAPAGMAGSGYIQPDSWSDVSGQSVSEVHSVSDSYLASRMLADYVYLFRCQEYHGCMGVGMNKARGILRTGNIVALEKICDASVEFDLRFGEGTLGDLSVYAVNQGFVESVEIDGAAVTPSSSGYEVRTSMCEIPASSLSQDGAWHHVKLTVSKASSATSFHVTRRQTASGYAGFLIDNITVRKIADRGKGALRVMYWNIQNGMWGGQGDNFQGFVDFVRKYDPDICIWCEAATIYKTGTYEVMPVADRPLPGGWSALAARYGHNYAELGAWRNNYPQAVTSKYPVTVVDKYTRPFEDKPNITNGASLMRVQAAGHSINIVTLHLWAQSYGPDVAVDDRERSSAAGEGSAQREFEMQTILDLTRGDSAYSDQTDWLMAGDFNSRSLVDNWYYGLNEGDGLFAPYKQIRDRSDYVDVIAERYPGKFIASSHSASRIDFVYASPSLSACVGDAVILADDWCIPKPVEASVYLRTPSDHRPIIVDFNF